MAFKDPFPTDKLNVPYLKDILERLRDEAAKRVLIVLYVTSHEEGDWILANTQSRLAKTNIAAVAAETMKPQQVIEKATHTKMPVALVGRVRSVDDAHAMRVAVTTGLKLVGYVVAKDRNEFNNEIVGLGPWPGVQPYCPER